MNNYVTNVINELNTYRVFNGFEQPVIVVGIRITPFSTTALAASKNIARYKKRSKVTQK